MHALIPYSLGGALDLYYFPNGLPGTAIATKELSTLPYEGSVNDVFRSYELVMFTKHAVDLDAAKDLSTPFGLIHEFINSALNVIAPYSATARLNPNHTCEVPSEVDDGLGGCCIFDAYACHNDDLAWDFGLLAVIRVFPSEMEFARKKKGVKLLERLKAKGFYPYSDLDREPVA